MHHAQLSSQGPHQAQPHPASPPDIVSQFSTLFRVRDSPVAAATTELQGRFQVYREFWHAPSRLSQSARSVTENEVAAVMVSLFQNL